MTGVTRYQLKRANKVGLQIIILWYLQLTIVGDARKPSNEGMIFERHKALLVVGDIEESSMYLSRQTIKKYIDIDIASFCVSSP